MHTIQIALQFSIYDPPLYSPTVAIGYYTNNPYWAMLRVRGGCGSFSFFLPPILSLSLSVNHTHSLTLYCPVCKHSWHHVHKSEHSEKGFLVAIKLFHKSISNVRESSNFLFSVFLYFMWHFLLSKYKLFFSKYLLCSSYPNPVINPSRNSPTLINL